jgi:tetratricopeptide (TPR) repeat protein
MRDLLDHADLARYAGQFVWLELNYDEAKNLTFFAKYGPSATPTFFIIDPQGQVAATQTGALSSQELTQFLDRAVRAVVGQRPAADAMLAQGDALLTLQPADAAKAYREALRLAPADWPPRELAEASLVVALQDSREWRQCAETAANEAVHMKRDAVFGRTVVAGMWCVTSAQDAPWLESAARMLEALAKDALSLPATIRDHRDELYRTLMYLSVNRGDKGKAAEWGNRWLAELDAVSPATDDERSAVDIARVENVQIVGEPAHILPALVASERAMPHNYNASLRVAQMESAAGHYDEAIAACDRGLARAPGATGRSWLLRTKAQALMEKGQQAEARRALQEALQAAQAIPEKAARDMNLTMISNALKQSEGAKQ